MLGGMTFCEYMMYVVTCGKSTKSKEFIIDDYIVKYQVMEEEYQHE